MRPFILLLVLISTMVLSSSFGATVTLTGSCSSSGATSNSVNVTFSLLNSGDFPASSISLIPSTFGPLASINISSKNIGSIYPNVTKNATFSLKNLPTPGTYIIKVMVSYFQGSSNFFAAFPCEFNYGTENLTNYIAPLSANYSFGTLKLDFFNIASKPLNVTTDIIAPPQVHYSPQSRNVDIAPQSGFNTSFNVSMGKLPGLSNASMGVSIVTGYSYGGFYHSTFENIVILSSGRTSSAFSGGFLIVIIFTAVIITLIGLIIFSVLHKKHKSVKPQ